MNGNVKSAGGRASARRLLVTMTIVACATSGTPAQTEAPADTKPHGVVQEERGVWFEARAVNP